jgi:hypothetical protein
MVTTQERQVGTMNHKTPILFEVFGLLAASALAAGLAYLPAGIYQAFQLLITCIR